MKIAVASIDGQLMSQHFGQSTGFVVFEVEGTLVKNREWRSARETPHAAGLCDPQEHSGPSQASGGQKPAGILGLIGDCDEVLCGGMGAGAAHALRQAGLRPIVLASTGSADEVVAQYIKGNLAPGQPLCQCQH